MVPLFFLIDKNDFLGMALNTSEKYDPHSNTWKKIANMNCSRASACCAAVNGKLYVIGKCIYNQIST